MPSKLRTAVIGVGNIGKSHARIYSEISNLVAIADLNEAIGEDIAQRFNCKFYKDFSQMLDLEKPDCVSIAVPTSIHHKVALEVLDRKIAVLLEKPIADNLENARKILNSAKRSKIPLLVGHLERFNPAVQKTKEIIESGKLGKIFSIIVRRVGGFPPQIKDVNIAVDLSIHDLDIVNFLLDEKPQKIFVNKRKNHLKLREDSVEFFMLYSSTSVYIQTNWVTPVKIRKLNITGTEGYLEMDFISQEVIFYKTNYEKLKEVDNEYEDFILKFKETTIRKYDIKKEEPLKKEIEYFLACVRKGKIISPEYSFEALKIALTN